MLNRRQFLERIVAFSIVTFGYSCKEVTDDDTMSPLPEGSDCSFCYDSIHNHDDPEPVVGMVNQEVSPAEGYIQNPRELNEDGIPVSLEGYVTRHEMKEEDNFNGREFNENAGTTVFRFSDTYIIHQGGSDHYFRIDLRNLDPPIPSGEIPAEIHGLGVEIAQEFLSSIGANEVFYSRIEDVSE